MTTIRWKSDTAQKDILNSIEQGAWMQEKFDEKQFVCSIESNNKSIIDEELAESQEASDRFHSENISNEH